MLKEVSFYSRLFQVEEVKLSLTIEEYYIGKPLADWLVNKLGNSEFYVNKPQLERCGWQFNAEKGKENISVWIDPAEQNIIDGNAQFSLIIEKEKSWSFFRKQYPSTFEEFCREIDNILRKESEISKISWKDLNLLK